MFSEKDYAHLDPQVKDYEPKGALIGGKKGVEFYERLSRELPIHLYPSAKVWFEIGHQQGKVVQSLFSDAAWKQRHVENDWSGHNRFFFLENE